MANQTKGRPPKPTLKRKRLHYSVWVNEEEKRQIDHLIEQSNLSASQFFITQVIEKPIQRPKKKTLPQSVVKQITSLEKLSGLLSLTVLKTKDNAMISQQWLESSQNVKWLSQLIILRIFEDFDLPNISSRLNQMLENLKIICHYFARINNDELKKISNKLLNQASELRIVHEKHYHSSTEPTWFSKVWTEEFDIHQEILHIKKQLLNQ